MTIWPADGRSTDKILLRRLYASVHKDVKLRFDARMRHVQDDFKQRSSTVQQKVRDDLKLTRDMSQVKMKLSTVRNN